MTYFDPEREMKRRLTTGRRLVRKPVFPPEGPRTLDVEASFQQAIDDLSISDLHRMMKPGRGRGETRIQIELRRDRHSGAMYVWTSRADDVTDAELIALADWMKGALDV